MKSLKDMRSRLRQLEQSKSTLDVLAAESGDWVTEVNTCYLAYSQYYATGEGVTAIIAVAGTAKLARETFKNRAPELFWGAMKVAQLAKRNEVVKQVSKMIPLSVLQLLETNPRGTTSFYGELHYNLA